MFTMKVEGGDQLAKRLTDLPAAMTRPIMVAALKAGGEPIRAAAAQAAPRKTGELASHMTISVANRLGSVAGGKWQPRDEQEHAVAVGPSKDEFYGLFQEYGTKFIGAHAFLRPAFDAKAPAALGIIVDRLWAALRKAVPQSFPQADVSTFGSWAA